MADPNFNIFSGWGNWWDSKVGDPMRAFIQRGKESPINKPFWSDAPPEMPEMPQLPFDPMLTSKFGQLFKLFQGQSEYDLNQALDPLNNLAPYKVGPDLGVFPMAKGGMVPQWEPPMPSDTLNYLKYKTFKYEDARGNRYGTGLPGFGYYKDPQGNAVNYTNAKGQLTNGVASIQEALAKSKEFDPYLTKFKTQMEKGEAFDFLFNTGRDPRIYMLDAYLKEKTGKSLPDRGKYNTSVYSAEWKGGLDKKFEETWNKYEKEINKLPQNERRQLLNKGRDFYYQNIERGPGAINENLEAYDNTWFGRMWNTNDMREFNPNDPQFKKDTHPGYKKELGGFNMELGGPVVTPKGYAARQTEEGEKILLPDLTLTDVAAKEKHKDMDDDEVTDLIPVPSYVFSNAKSTSLKKKDFEGKNDIPLFTSPTYYDDAEPTSNEYRMNFSDLFTKPVMTPAELAQRVKEMFPVSGRTDSSIYVMTDSKNKETAAKVLETLIEQVELRTKRKPSEIMKKGGFVQKMPQGGYVYPKKMGNGGFDFWDTFADFSSAISFISPVAGIVGPMIKADKQQKESDEKIEGLFSGLGNNLTASTALNALISLGQKGEVPRQDFEAMQALVETMPTSYSPMLKEYLANQARMPKDALFANTTNYNKAAQAQLSSDAAGLDILSKNAVDLYGKELGLQATKNQARFGLAEAREKERLGAASLSQAIGNKRWTDLMGTGVNHLNELSKLDTSRYQLEEGIEGQIEANKKAQISQNMNNLLSAIQLAFGMGNMFGSKTPTDRTYSDSDLVNPSQSLSGLFNNYTNSLDSTFSLTNNSPNYQTSNFSLPNVSAQDQLLKMLIAAASKR